MKKAIVFFTLFHIGNQKLFFSFLSRGAGLTEPAPQTRPPIQMID